MRGRLGLCFALLLITPSVRGQDLIPLPFPESRPPHPATGLFPQPTREGEAALDRLLAVAEKAGALKVVRDPRGKVSRYSLRDEDRLKAVLGTNRGLLTPVLRDTVVAGWNDEEKAPEPPRGGFAGFGQALADRVATEAPKFNRVDEEQARVGVLILRVLGEESKDARALAYAAFLEGKARERRADHAAALSEYQQARQQFVTLKDRAWEAACLNNLGSVEAACGEYQRAVEYLQQGYAASVAAYGNSHRAVAEALGNIGFVYHVLKEQENALKYLRQALDVWRKLHGNDHPHVAACLTELGDVYAAMPDSADSQDRAEEYYRQALAVWRKLLSKNQPSAATIIDIAIVSDPAINTARALEEHQALTTLYKVYGENSSLIAANLDRLGNVAFRKREYDKALATYRQVLTIRRQVLGETHREVAASLRNLGAVHRAQGKDADALEALTKAVLALRQGVEGKRTALAELRPEELAPLPLTVEVLQSWGEVQEGLAGASATPAQLRTCAGAYRLAAGVLERVRREVLQSAASKEFLGEERFELFPRHVGVCRRLFAAEQKAEDLETAFAVAEQGTARVFLEQLGKSRAEVIGRVGDELRRQEADLLNQLREVDRRIDRERDRPLREQDAKVVGGLLEERRRREDRERQLVERMAREYPRYAALKYPRPCTPAEARTCLAAREVAVLYVLGAEASYAVLLEPGVDFGDRTGGLAVYRLPPAEKIGDQVSALTDPDILEKPARVQALGAEAYALLVAPFAERIKGKDLVIVPGGALCYLPFELLVEGGGKGEAGRYLLETHGIRYAPSLTALHLGRQWERARARPARPLWAGGGPVYDVPDERLAVKKAVVIASKETGAESASRLARIHRAGGPNYHRLPSSGPEVRTLQRLFGASEESVLTGVQAAEAAVKTASEKGVLAEARYVHFATHGILGLDVGLQPSLVLSLIGNDGGRQGGGLNDGFLQLDEITNLNLNADLVVLSACRSGLGRLRNGEGVRGLTRAFLYAGSRGVICSLWSVADQETAELMVGLYGRLKEGDPAAKALRDAKLAMLRAGKAPLYWAPFILIGE